MMDATLFKQYLTFFAKFPKNSLWKSYQQTKTCLNVNQDCQGSVPSNFCWLWPIIALRTTLSCLKDSIISTIQFNQRQKLWRRSSCKSSLLRYNPRNHWMHHQQLEWEAQSAMLGLKTLDVRATWIVWSSSCSWFQSSELVYWRSICSNCKIKAVATLK